MLVVTNFHPVGPRSAAIKVREKHNKTKQRNLTLSPLLSKVSSNSFFILVLPNRSSLVSARAD